jgi:hypothetical protein
MITIPFYNHHFNSSETGKSVSMVFSVLGAKIIELPCLCQYSSPYQINRPVAIVHGIRKNHEQCYPKIGEHINANPNTLFYVWAVNLEEDKDTLEFLDKNRCPQNCKLITAHSVVDVVEEAEKIFIERKHIFQRT